MKNIRLVIAAVFIIFKSVLAQKCETYGRILYSFPSCNTDEYTLAFEDNFDGNALDYSKWDNTYPWARTGIGNPEQEYYSNGNNIDVSNGTLKLIAKKETVYERAIPYFDDNEILIDGIANKRIFNYTSGMIFSKFKFFYGKYEVRCRMPKGMGFWPAFWLFGGQRWNELDMFEIYGDNIERYTCGIIHDYDGNKDADEGEKCGYGQNNVTDFTQWHTFTCIFNFDKIVFQIDGNTIHTFYRIRTATNKIVLCGEEVAYGTYFDLKAYPLENMNLILNLAVQSETYAPDASTTFPGIFEIDYVRYYKQKDCCQEMIFTKVEDLNLNSDPSVYNFICGKNFTFNDGFTIKNGQNIKIIASSEIIFKPGFTIENGSNFIAKIDTTLSCKNNKYENKVEVIKESVILYNVNDSVNIKIFPNPAHQELSVTCNSTSIISEDYKIYLFNTQGQKILDHYISRINEKINISNCEPGIYFIHIVDEKSKTIYTDKIILE